MESLEAWSLLEATSPEGSSEARLMRLPVERRSRDWEMSAWWFASRLIPKFKLERPRTDMGVVSD